MADLPPLLITSDVLNNQLCFFSCANNFTSGPLFLNNPVQIFVAHYYSEVPLVLRQAELAARGGGWVAGFVTYEASGGVGMPVLPGLEGHPLVWMAVFSGAYRGIWDSDLVLNDGKGGEICGLGVDFVRYREDLQAILGAIGRGETYQVNHTVAATVGGCDPGGLFLQLQCLHRFPYGCWLNFGAGRVASFSPELFVHVCGDAVTTAPIKGTRPRVHGVMADERMAVELETSVKDRAEHVMIVDMARNDLGRICAVGTVRGEYLYERRSFSTIHHLETRVRGRLRGGVGLGEVMEAMFPAASITGAPKWRAMEIIREREGRPRGIYTGSLGLLAPGERRWVFNVAIRTVTWWGGEMGRMGLGGGIVADSEVAAEWRELADKGRFLGQFPKPFGLIETCLVDGEGKIPELRWHMERLARSAVALGFPLNGVAIQEELERRALACCRRPRVLRLVLDMGGGMTMTERDFVVPSEVFKVCLAPVRLDRLDFTLRHKTTRREIFDTCLAQARAGGFDDCIFVNNVGHVTEGAIRGIAVRLGDGWVVPPLADGLLSSLWRGKFMRHHKVREQSLGVEDLVGALEIRMGNAVSGEVVVARLADESGQMIKIF